jgi:sec-independent protein translocase protein TatA
MFNLGPLELSLIFGIVIVLFGANRLPSIATGIGLAIRNLKSSMNETHDDGNNKNNKVKPLDKS